MDEPVVYKGQTGPGLYYIQDADNYFPLRVNGWYYSNTVEYCLVNDIIKTTNIKYVVLASLTVKKDHYNGLIDYLYEKLDDDLKKLSVN